MSEEMRKLAEIRHSFSIKQYGEPTNEEIALIKYDELCLSLIFKNEELKEELKDENNYHKEAVKWYKEAFDREQEIIKYKSVLDEIREYIENHKIEWIDKKFDEHNVMVKFNEYTNPQAMLQILDKAGSNE